MSRFKSNIYYTEKFIFKNGHHYCIESDDGTLFTDYRRTKILAQDLPEWYVFGRYHKCFGYMSTKGITDLLYIPHKWSNHYLKDDCLYVSYGGKIEPTEIPESGAFYERYKGYDEMVWGGEILKVIQGAQKYSGFDISSLIEQLKQKKEWLISKYSDEFGPERWSFDVDEYFSKPFANGQPEKYFAITLYDYFSPSFGSGVKRYYGTLDQIKAFVESLNYEDHKSTIDAFHAYLEGNTEATHFADYAERKLLEPVTFIKQRFVYQMRKEWEFKNVWGCIYKMRCDCVHSNAVLIKDGDQYIRCICPVLEKTSYNSEIHAENEWHPLDSLWGHPGILSFGKDQEVTIQSSLYLPEKKYSDVKEAVAELGSDDINLDIVCEDIFADG